nr:radical SAM protein [Methylomonas rhizoryzae]
MDIEILRSELELLLDDIISGEFYERFEVPPEAREIKDIALSGNGEPSSLTNFHEAVSTIAHTAKNKKIFPACKFILITNGSLLHKPNVCQGLVCLAQNNGEIWFKLDSATTEGRRLLNNSRQSRKHLVNNLKIASEHCPTKLQTCMLHYGDAWSNDEKTAYLSLLTELQRQNISIRGVMLYSLARPSLQPEAPSLDKASELEIKAFAADIEKLGYDVSVNG